MSNPTVLVEHHATRRLTGRLERGCELIAALTTLCRQRELRDATLRATGVVDEVELSAILAASGQPGPTRRYGSHFGLVHCDGRLVERDGQVELHAECVLSREGESGIELVGGRLLRARACSVDFVLEGGPGETVRVTSAEPATTTWADVARSSATRGAVETHAAPLVAADDGDESDGLGGDDEEAPWAGDDSPDEEPLRHGDVLVHPRFGACGVERIEGANEYAQVRLANQRLVRLSLEVLRLTRDGQDDRGRRRFRAVVDV